MTGEVDSRGTSVLRLTIAGREWVAVIDTGFDGELELPDVLASHFRKRGGAPARTTLGGGTVIDEELFLIDFPFDGESVPALASFAPVSEILVGTELLLNYRLEVNFVARTVILERIPRPQPTGLIVPVHRVAPTMNLRPPRRVPPDARPL